MLTSRLRPDCFIAVLSNATLSLCMGCHFPLWLSSCFHGNSCSCDQLSTETFFIERVKEKKKKQVNQSSVSHSKGWRKYLLSKKAKQGWSHCNGMLGRCVLTFARAAISRGQSKLSKPRKVGVSWLHFSPWLQGKDSHPSWGGLNGFTVQLREEQASE